MNLDELKVSLGNIEKNLDKLEAGNEKAHDKLFNKVDELSIKVAEQRVKSGFIGAITGAIPATIVALYIWIKSIPK